MAAHLAWRYSAWRKWGAATSDPPNKKEPLQRLVAMTAIPFLLFEPESWVEGNDKLKPLADDLLSLILAQLNWLKKKYSQKW